jgi:hypothetical protein
MPPRLSRLLPPLSLALVLLVIRCRVSGAQQAPASDSARAAIPSVDAARVGVGLASAAATTASDATHNRRNRLPVIYYGALAGAAGATAVLRVDPDSGGYRDGWTTATDFPDKAVHALAAWAITTVGVDLGARPRHAALAVCAAGTAFEFAQGYVSPYDIAADCVGASGAALWQSWRAKRRARAAKAKAAAVES